MILDYLQTQASKGNRHYQEVLDFYDRHRIAPSTSVAMLAGQGSFNEKLQTVFYGGEFKVQPEAREFADEVASLYNQITAISREVYNIRFLQTCAVVLRVPGFKPSRFVQNARRCRDKLVPYSTMDACLTMVEDVYNFAKRDLLAVKIEAMKILRDRNPVKRKAG